MYTPEHPVFTRPIEQVWHSSDPQGVNHKTCEDAWKVQLLQKLVKEAKVMATTGVEFSRQNFIPSDEYMAKRPHQQVISAIIFLVWILH